MKNILTTLIIAGCISIILFFFFRDDDSKNLSVTQEKFISVVNSDDNTENTSKPATSKQTLVRTKASNHKEITKSKIKLLSATCGLDFTDQYLEDQPFNTILNFNKNLETKSEKQLMAQNLINSECEYWYEYINELSNEEINKIRKDKADAINPLNYYLARDQGDYDKLINAKESVNNGNENASIELGYLLETDNDLLTTIAENLGTEDIDYIKNSRINISALFECEINPKSCSPKSIENLNTCLIWEEFCGISSQQYIASIVSPNQYSDLFNIVEIIKMLIKQGYFV